MLKSFKLFSAVNNLSHRSDLAVFGIEDDSPMKRWRCTKGHSWESPTWIVGFSYGLTGDLPAALVEEKQLDFCLLCMLELMKEHCGVVEEEP